MRKPILYAIPMGLALAMLAACTATTPAAQSPAASSAPSASPSASPPAAQAPAPRAVATAPVLDRSCKTAADCAIKDVGSCCGAMPACVNKDSRVDPAAVQADCAKRGMASVCGFSEIKACACAGGQCTEDRDPAGGWIDGSAPQPDTER